jgi:dihydroxy-acid dehydratase
VGGPIALVADGDVITIDATTLEISVAVSDDVLQLRKEKWQAPPSKAKNGWLHKYSKLVSSASLGCPTDI